VGGALLLHAAGIVRLPFLEGSKPPAEPDRTGMVEVPVSAVAIPAYAQVVREHLWDVRRGRLTFVYLRPKDVTPEMLTSLADVLGGVLKREKPAGYVFTKADFFPKGTRPGPSAGIPPGKRAMRMAAKDLPGLHGLKQGDQFDVVMAVEVEIEEPRTPPAAAAGSAKVEGPYAGLATAQAAPPTPAPKIIRKRADVRTVVKAGVVVEPVTTRKEIETSSSLMRGTRYETKPIEEIVIAVEPEEVAALQQAIAIKATLHVAMRSGQATVDGKTVEERDIPNLEVEIVPPEAPAAGEAAPAVRIVEVIQGGKKKLMAVPVGPQPAEGEKAPEKPSGGGTPAPEGGAK
jgi:Flp pilus assembly protein CpaB